MENSSTAEYLIRPKFVLLHDGKEHEILDDYPVEYTMEFLPRKGDFFDVDGTCYEVLAIAYCYKETTYPKIYLLPANDFPGRLHG
ncbi:hypothetical protein [Gilvimarinus agarilyticus]|uniref:hypothetical protein n=1 Tax=Gilvimarinus agarilyticus TaxID=679259 RepID=UPI0005A104DD|nr:hypothetical protein [Gilvimarinus agarilyticus]